MRMPKRRVTLVALALGTILLGTAGCESDFLPFPSSRGDTESSPSPSSTAPVPLPSRSSPSPLPPSSPAPPPSSTPAPPPFDKTFRSIDDPASIWVVSNKLRSLHPADFVPPDLVVAPVPYVSNPEMRSAAAAAMAQMFATGEAEGAGSMQIQNAYRSYSVQTSVHNRLVASLGAAKADAQSARPGYSEHQTGLSADITSLPEKCSIQACFGDTPQGIWLATNAWRFGFVLRYPADKTPVTGYIYEPWHFRYVGPELSAEMHERGVSTLEEFFGLPAAPDYAPAG